MAFKITVKTLFGFEEILLDELKELGYTNCEIQNRAVQLSGNWEDVYRLNYRCRLAISVLIEIDSFYIHSDKDLYNKAKNIQWSKYFDLDKTFAVKGAVFSTLYNHTQYPYLVLKDAIVDHFYAQQKERPNVNPKNPQVLFDLYIKEKLVVISLNTSGLPLFQRGYRQETGDAPINEVLAAGLIRLSGWDRKSPFIDPMCGAGTIAIEAALMAADIPAMIERQHYAFKNLKSFDADLWDKVQTEGNKRPIKLDFPIIANDEDAGMLQKAKRNAKVAPIGNMIQFSVGDFEAIDVPKQPGVLICNPPYGERIGEDIEQLYERLGSFFKHQMTGYQCHVISSNEDGMKSIGLKPSKKWKVYNGKLEAFYRAYHIFEGSKKVKNSNDQVEDVHEDAHLEEKVKIEVTKSAIKTPKKRSYKLQDDEAKSEAVETKKQEEIEEQEAHGDVSQVGASSQEQPKEATNQEVKSSVRAKVDALKKYTRRTD